MWNVNDDAIESHWIFFQFDKFSTNYSYIYFISNLTRSMTSRRTKLFLFWLIVLYNTCNHNKFDKLPTRFGDDGEYWIQSSWNSHCDRRLWLINFKFLRLVYSESHNGYNHSKGERVCDRNFTFQFDTVLITHHME